MSVTIKRRHADIGLFGLFLALAILAFRHTGSFPDPLLRGYPGSAMFPRLVLAAMALFCALGIARRLLAPDIAARPISLPVGGLARAVAVAAGFVLLFAAVGVEVASFIAAAGAIWLQSRRLGLALGVGVFTVIVVYAIFVQLLGVHLPLAFLPRYLG